jgi:hypothetical protein
MPCLGFNNSKTRNKHYKKHVLGKPANAFGAGDMAKLAHIFKSAAIYEQHGVSFMNQVGHFHSVDFPIVELHSRKRKHTVRWNQNTGELGVMDQDGYLITYHLRNADGFQAAVLEEDYDGEIVDPDELETEY